ncbi:hypothetical protein [Chloroflexus aggregans]|uniref:hypothetical protein n=1 Tax=Chloroflexus aggregans TaxID=152260 RepID=UPI00059BFE64|nr:hypothetical protein [Chloroflexus aggregans]
MTNLVHPTEAGFYDTPGDAVSVVVAQGYAYVAAGKYGLRIISANSANSIEVASLDPAYGYAYEAEEGKDEGTVYREGTLRRRG